MSKNEVLENEESQNKPYLKARFSRMLELIIRTKEKVGIDQDQKMIDIVNDFVEKYGEEIINFTDEDGENLLHYAVRYEKSHFADYLIWLGVDLEQKSYRDQTPLQMAYPLIVNDDNITDGDLAAAFLIKAGAKFNFDHPEVFKILTHIVSDPTVTEEQMDKVFADFSAKQRDTVVKAANAVAFLKWNYSKFGYFVEPQKATELLAKYGARDESLRENNAVFLQALEIMLKPDLADVGDKKISVMQLPYLKHVGYFVIEWSKDEQPLRVFYCDSYCAIDRNIDDRTYNHGAVGFEVGDRNLSKAEIEWQTNEIFANIPYNSSNLEDGDMTDIKNIFHVSRQANPSFEIPTKSQSYDRSICAMKSSKIAMRMIAKLISGKEYALNEAGEKPCGELYEQYKIFMRGAIDAAIDDFVEVLSQRDLPYHAALVDYVKDFVKTARRKVEQKSEVEGGDEAFNSKRLAKLMSCLDVAQSPDQAVAANASSAAAGAAQGSVSPVV